MALLDDMRGERGGGGSDDSGVAGIIKAVAPLAGPLLQMAATQQANRVALPAPTIPIPPQPVRDMSGVPSRPAPVAPPTSNPSAPTSQPISEAEMFGELKPIVDNLVLTMQNGAEPVGVADFFFEQTFMNIEDDKVYDQLADFVESPTCIQRLGFFNPAVAANVAWFEKFRARVIELLNAPEAPAVQGPPNPAPVTPAA
jgi:hypothetical protein